MQLCQRKAACPARPLPKAFPASSRRLGGCITRFDVKDAADKMLGDAPVKDVVLLLLEQAQQLAQKDMQLAQKDFELAFKDMQLKAVENEFKLQTVTRELLHARGLLHMRGLLEYAEGMWLPSGAGHAAPQSRQKIWETILQNNPQLLACAQGCLRGKPDHKSVARNLTNVYGSLSGHIHQFSRTAVDIVEGPFNKEQMRLLECIAIAASVPYNMIYRIDTDVAPMMSDQSSEDAVSDGDDGKSAL